MPLITSSRKINVSLFFLCKQRRRLIISIVIFVLPLIIASALFNPFQKYPIYNNVIGNESSTITLPFEGFIKPSLANNVRKIFAKPFDLTYYDLYLVNAAYFRDARGNEIAPIWWEANISGALFNVTSKPVKIKSLKMGENYPLHLGLAIEFTPETIKRLRPETGGGQLMPVINIYGMLSIWDVVAQWVIFLLAWLGTAMLIRSSVEAVKK